MPAKSLENRIFYVAQRCHTHSAKLLDRSHLIMCLNYLTLAQTATDSKIADKHYRMAVIAYNRAMKDNNLPSEDELKEVFGDEFDDVIKSGGV